MESKQTIFRCNNKHDVYGAKENGGRGTSGRRIRRPAHRTRATPGNGAAVIYPRNIGIMNIEDIPTKVLSCQWTDG